MRACWERWRRCSPISVGPVAQLRPMTSGCRGSMAASAAPISVPGSIRPVSSMVTWTWSGDLTALSGHGPAGGDHRRLQAEQVVLGLDDEEVDATLEQAVHLHLVGVAEVGEGDVAEGRHLGAGPDRAGHEAGVVRGRDVVHDLAGQAGRGDVQLVGPVGEVVLGEGDGEGAEGVGLHHVAAHVEVGGVELADGVGPGDHEELVAALQVRATEVVGGEVEALEEGPRRPVVDDDAFVHEIEEPCHPQRLPRGVLGPL